MSELSNEWEIMSDLLEKKLYIIIEKLIKSDSEEMYLKKLSDETTVSMASTYRILKKLIEKGLVKEIKIGPAKIYRLARNKKTELLKNWFSEKVDPLDEFIKRASSVSGIIKIFLHDKKGDDSSDLMIIGVNINLEQLNTIASDIYEKYNYKLKILPLTEDQYQQMSSLNMITGTKKLLWSSESY